MRNFKVHPHILLAYDVSTLHQNNSCTDISYDTIDMSPLHSTENAETTCTKQRTSWRKLLTPLAEIDRTRHVQTAARKQGKDGLPGRSLHQPGTNRDTHTNVAPYNQLVDAEDHRPHKSKGREKPPPQYSMHVL